MNPKYTKREVDVRYTVFVNNDDPTPVNPLDNSLTTVINELATGEIRDVDIRVGTERTNIVTYRTTHEQEQEEARDDLQYDEEDGKEEVPCIFGVVQYRSPSFW